MFLLGLTEVDASTCVVGVFTRFDRS
jgi:hypothetical protein